MYDVSTDYKYYIRDSRKLTRTISGRLWYEENGVQVEQTWNDSNVVPRTLSYVNQCSPDNEFKWGQVSSGQLNVTLRGLINLDAWKDKEMYITFSVTYPETGDIIPFQHFDVDGFTIRGKQVNIKAFDYMTRFDKELKRAIYGRPYACLHALCEQCGVQLGNTQSEIEAMPNGQEELFLDPTELPTGRDMLHNMASLMCGFATISRESKLVIRQFPDMEHRAHREIIPKNRIVDSTEWGKEIKFLGYDAVFWDFEGQSNIRYTADVDDKDLLKIGDIYGVNRYVKTLNDPITVNFTREIAKINYTMLSTSIPPDPSLDIGDIITNSEVYEDSDKKTIITRLVYRYSEAMTIECNGATDAQRSVKSAEAKLRDATRIAIQKNTFVSMAVSNAEELALTDTYERVAFFRFGVADDCHTMINVMFPLVSELDGDLDVKFVINDVEETAETFSHQFVKGHTIVTIAQEYNFSRDDMIMIEVYARNRFVETENRVQNAHIESLENAVRFGAWVDPVIDTRIPEAHVAANMLRAFLWGKGIESFGGWSGMIFASDEITVVDINGIATSDLEISYNIGTLEVVAGSAVDTAHLVPYGNFPVPLIGGDTITVTLEYVDAITYVGEISCGQEWLL